MKSPVGKQRQGGFLPAHRGDRKFRSSTLQIVQAIGGVTLGKKYRFWRGSNDLRPHPGACQSSHQIESDFLGFSH